MASESDGEEMLEATYSSMEQPPLIKQLRQILSEYPDNGQIIKEMLQNAEDARASQVEIIYDERCINREKDSKKTFRKFFKGPALCVKNNSEFDDDDWKGIKMIAGSIKEDDKLKVGRFGLGFKSVFHMTDYPCIMSGDRILMVDPTRPSDQVNAEIKLKNLRRTKGMDVEAFLQAFRETLGIDESIINQGHYPGTVFWFPLREDSSKISSTLYDRERVRDLFTSFEHDSSEILLFLCHLERVSLHKRGVNGELTSVAAAEISNNDVRQKRDDFVKQITARSRNNQGHTAPIICSYDMTVRTSRHQGYIDETTWSIVHYFMGSNCSTRLQQLNNDPDLGFNPVVGVAMPITLHQQPFEGHVFCFMPLPREGSRLTGLPVHVNGFFSLSQNRHHLKWATDDQMVREIRDMDILWNQAMIEECVPAAYICLLDVLLKKAKDNGNDKQSVERVYRAVPHDGDVLDKWRKIPQQLINHLQNLQFLYSQCQNRYVKIGEALFTTFTNLPDTLTDCEADITNVTSMMNRDYVRIDKNTITKLKYYNNNIICDLTPATLANMLKQNVATLSKLSNSQKFSILSYLLSGNNYNSCLAGLPLLPIASGKWQTFGSGGLVFLCESSVEVDMFDSFQDQFIYRTLAYSDYIWQHLDKMATYKIGQIRRMDASSFRDMLNKTLQVKVGSSYIITSPAQLNWLQKVWKYIENNLRIDQLGDMTLIPELKEGTWIQCRKIQLHPLTGIFLKKSGISDRISECFRCLGAVLLADFPPWFPERLIGSYICSYQQNGSIDIHKLLQKLWNQPSSRRQTQINTFNINMDHGSRDEFTTFMSQQLRLDGHGINLVRCLKIFKCGNFTTDITYLSRNDQQTYVTITETDFPVRLPKSFILASGDSVPLLQYLGAGERTHLELVQLSLNEMRKTSFYNEREIKVFMRYFLEHIWEFQGSGPIMSLATEIPFLTSDSGKFKAKDLFTPEDDLLQSMFCGQTNKFPLHYSNLSNQCKTALKRLGLKDVSKVSAEDVGDVASLIHQWSNDPNKHDTAITKSCGLLTILNSHHTLLQYSYRGTTLKGFLLQKRFVVCLQDKPSHFPASLPRYPGTFCTPLEARDRTYPTECLVGATMPLVESEYANLSAQFGWTASPPSEQIIKQLMLLKQTYKPEERSNILPMIDRIYDFMSQNIGHVNLTKMDTEGLVWTGDSFQQPSYVIIKVGSEQIKDLKPYFFTIPEEFSKHENLFKRLGCRLEQSVSVLMEALRKIKEKHFHPQPFHDFERDYDLVVKIVDTLAERRYEVQDQDVILPVQNDSTSQIQFHPASMCTVDKNVSRFVHEKGDNTIVFVSHRISQDSAKALGAKPLNKQVLMGTESMGIEGFGQTEKLTDRIHKLITESYVDGLSVPKELIQNADDAGADVIKFLFDEREHEDAKDLLLSQEMAGCQGPALVVYNNATFSDADFENIKRLNGATKEMDKSKVGRFGLGFCAVYNLTDIPSFVSRSTVVIFDPQKSYLKGALEDNSPGIKINFKKVENRKLLRLHKDQFKPYQNLFGCMVDKLPEKEFNGTMFRLPLRNSSQAEQSEISKLSYNRDEMCDLLTMLVKNVGNMLLFTQNVKTIEVYHLPRNAKCFEHKVLLCTASKKLHSRVPVSLHPPNMTVLQRVEASLAAAQHFREIQQLNIHINVTQSCFSLLSKTKTMKTEDDSSWLITWELGKNKSLQMSREIQGERAVPLSAVAVQCDQQFQYPIVQSEQSGSFYDRGHLFCFLPLPIETSLCFHLNGSFHVTSDRRRLISLTDDDKQSRKDKWNEYLLEDASVNAFFTVLEYFSQRNTGSFLFHQLWPLNCSPVVNSFHDSFFQRIMQEEKKLFFGNRRWVSFPEVVFLDPDIRNDLAVGEIGFRMLSKIGVKGEKVLVDLPGEFMMCLMKVQNIEKWVIREAEFLNIFLENISDEYWKGHIHERNELLCYALESNNTDIKSKMKEYNCIPVEPYGTLKRPCDIVDKNGKVAAMFKVEDEVFLVTELQKKQLTEELSSLGMIRDRLSDKMLIERCEAIEKLAATQSTSCAVQLCQLLIQYLNQVSVRGDLKQKNELQDSIAHMLILPVLQKPSSWTNSWNSDNDKGLKTFNSFLSDDNQTDRPCSLQLGQPVQLYLKGLYWTGGSVCSFVDEDLLTQKKFTVHKDVWKVLKVNKKIPIQQMIEQILILTHEYNISEKKENLITITNEIYKHLQKKTKKEGVKEVFRMEFEKIKTLSYVLVNGRLYKPSQVVFDLTYECPPYLIKLPQLYATMYRDVFQAMGIRDKIDVTDIIHVLRDLRIKWKDRKCDDLELIRNLLLNLVEFEDYNFAENIEHIVAPDTEGYLYPMNELVTSDDDFHTNRKMHVLNDSIPPVIAKKLGAKDKQRKCHDVISIGIPFGQKEKLVSRIWNLLEAYPCDSSIMKELLQNADDAKATKISFIKDYRSHSTKTLFADSCHSFQGPSLCVFNDSHFTEKDLQGIHDLGEGSKRQDPTKIGRYGVGFNSVYHLTDTPAFLSNGPGISDNGFLVIFDPTCTTLPGVRDDEPGRKYNVADLEEEFPDILMGFECRKHLFEDNKGTLFRFPLRNNKSSISKEIHSEESIDKILSEVREELFEALLFVKNVQCIQVANITSGDMVVEYSVRAEISDEDKTKRANFFDHIKQVCKEAREDISKLIFAEKREVSYRMKICDNQGREESFIIVQRFGLGDCPGISSTVTETFRREGVGYMPWGGVAYRVSDIQYRQKLSSTEKVPHTVARPKIESKAFCFLPLPGTTSLPVHINGCFRLDDARRCLIKDGFGKDWNECVLKHLIVPAYAQCVTMWRDSLAGEVKKLKRWYDVINLSENYHHIFPLMKNMYDPFWKFLLIKFYRFVLERKLSLFPVFQVENESSAHGKVQVGKKEFSCEWVPIGYRGDLRSGCFNTLRDHFSSYTYNTHKLESILKTVELKIVHTPLTVKSAMMESGGDLNSEKLMAALKTGQSEEILKDIKKAVSQETLFCSSPDEVVAFIATATHAEGPCHIGSPGSSITDTQIKSADRLKQLLYFLTKSEEKFMKSLPDLLMLLTGDDKLNVFCKDQPVYCTEFSWMFPGEMDKFVHHDLLHAYLTESMLKEGYVEAFTITSFIELIPSGLKESLYNRELCVQWNHDELPTTQWIVWLWKFIRDISKTGQDKMNKFKETLACVSDWNFLPVLDMSDSKLIQVSKLFMLVDICSFAKDEPLQESLKKLRPLTLDESIFYEGKYYSYTGASEASDTKAAAVGSWRVEEEERRNRKIAHDIIRSVNGLITSHGEPTRLLENLFYCAKNHKSVFDRIDTDGAVCILKYFTESLRNAKFREYTRCKDKLMSLPLFVTLNDSRVSLDDGRRTFVIPPEMPGAGLDSFSMNTNAVLLKKDNELDGLYNFLGLKDTTASEFYAYVLLPNFTLLPQVCWLVHIEYIRDAFLYWTAQQRNKEQKSMISILREIEFIETNSGFKKCSCFFYHNIVEFKVLCSEEEFLPEYFRTGKWTNLLIELGMHHDITDDLLIMFAKRIERASQNQADKSVEEKSLTLSKCFTSKTWEADTLYTLANIHFIEPAELCTMYRSIFPQRNDGHRLLCMQGAVESKHVALCWSTANVLRIKVSKELHEIVGICSEPRTVDVLKHCQNISTEMRRKIESLKNEGINHLMKKIYTFLQKHRQDPKVKNMLQTFPVIHLPDEHKMVTVNDIVMNIAEYEILKPFLFKAPVDYGPFFDLFESLGAFKEVQCFHYLNVLNQVRMKTGEQEVMPAELRVIKQAVSSLNISLKHDSRHEFKDLKLYLPNTRKVMCLSTDLVMVDNWDTRERLLNVTDINFCIGAQELEVHYFDPKEFVKHLPEQLRPKLLTDFIKEVSNTDNMDRIHNSKLAQKLSYFVQSEQFIRGICRIVKKDKEARVVAKSVFDLDTYLNRIKEMICKVTIVQVKKLETYLMHKGEIVRGSCRPLDRFYQQPILEDGSRAVHFYFCLCQEKNDASALVDLTSRPGGLAEALIAHLDLDLSYSGVLMVATMLRELEDPDGLASLLDREKYPDLDVQFNVETNSVFPAPGSYVEEKFHPFLQQALDIFDESEYKSVALEMDDDEDSENEADDLDLTLVYKYVHIIERITTDTDEPTLVGIRYKVDIGEEEFIEVPGYRLYRFVRPENPSDTVEVHTGVSPQHFLPFDENCSRIRRMMQEAWGLPARDRRKVFQRLILQWHPDKNRGSEEYATKIFQFIQQCILRLEETGTLSDLDETDGRAADFSHSSYNNMYNNVNRRAQAYARAYYDNIHEYNQSHHTGNYRHRSESRAEVRDVREARRWMKQAKRDFQAATTMIPTADDPKAFNWICYMCHQSSEKALKAACYSRNANAVSLQDHSLEQPASVLSPHLTSLASQMERLLGVHTRMRYPNSVNRPQIPADIFDKTHAEKAVELTREIIEHADDLIQN